MISPADVEAIERATLAAVAPSRVEAVGRWLVPLNPGTIGRAKSAVPVAHDLAVDLGQVALIESLFEQAGLPAQFRIADVSGLQALRGALQARGYQPTQRTLVKVGSVLDMSTVNALRAECSRVPPPGWADVFCGPGFDPQDGAHRVAVLSRSPGALYASVKREGRIAAVGVGSFGNDWVSVHGMRTDEAFRGQGLAGQILAGIAEEARARGIARVFLQVLEANAPAQALYRRAGFHRAWLYDYWARHE